MATHEMNISVANFIEFRPLITEILRHAK